MKLAGKNYNRCLTRHSCGILFINCLQMSPEVNQRLVQNSENFGKILAQTLNNETSKILETQENIGNFFFRVSIL